MPKSGALYIKYILLFWTILFLSMVCVSCAAKEKANYENSKNNKPMEKIQLFSNVYETIERDSFLADFIFHLENLYKLPIQWSTSEQEADIILNIQQDIAWKNTESFQITSRSELVKIEAGSSIGLQNGVYSFLESLGVRWYFPGEEWTFIPELHTVQFPVYDSLVDPLYLHRRLFYTFGFGPLKQSKAEFHLWQKRNKNNSAMKGMSGHSYKAIVPKDLFTTNPSWFPYIKGKRQRRGQLCISNKDMQQHAIEWIRKFEKRKPQIDIISVSPNDGGRWCECDQCVAIGGPTDQAMYFANLLAGELQSINSQKFIRLNAYFETALPGKITPAQNVIIYIADGYSAYSYEELLPLWHAQTKQLGLRDYFSYTGKDLPKWEFETLAEKLAFSSEYGVKYFHVQAGDQWIPRGLTYYLSAKLLWDPTLNESQILNDFIQQNFAESSTEMAQLFQSFKSKNLNKNKISDWVQLVSRASEKTNDLASQQRLNKFKLYLIWVDHYFENQKEINQKNNSSAAYEILKFVWRIKNEHILHSHIHFKKPHQIYKGITAVEKTRLNQVKKMADRLGPLNSKETDLLFTRLVVKYPRLEISKANTKNPFASSNTFTKINHGRSAQIPTAKIKPRYRNRNTFLLFKENDQEAPLSFSILKSTPKGDFLIEISSIESPQRVLIKERLKDLSSKTFDVAVQGLKAGTYIVSIKAKWLWY